MTSTYSKGSSNFLPKSQLAFTPSQASPESWCVEFHEPPTAPPRKGGRFIQQQKIRSPDLMFFSKLQRPMSLCICQHCGFQGRTRNFGCKLGKFHASHPSMSKYQAPAVGRVGDSSRPISVHNSHCFNLAQSVQQQLTMVSPKKNA